MICEVRDGDMCSVAGGLGRAVGGKWSPPGVHNPQAALRLLGCPAPPLTPENCVQKLAAWTVGARRSLHLSHAGGKDRAVWSASGD